MNISILKQTAILSLIAGLIFGVINFIPYVSFLSFTVLMLCLSVFIFVYLKKKGSICSLSYKDGLLYGAVSGFLSFIAFAVIYIPVSAVLGKLFPSYIQGSLKFFFTSFGSFLLLIFFVIMTAGISAMFNAFSGLAAAFVSELLGTKKDEQKSNVIDFKLK